MKAFANCEKSKGPLYPRQYEMAALFTGNAFISFRPIKPTDAELLKEFFRSHSEETVLHRYFIPMHDLPNEMLNQFVNIDYHNDMAIVGLVPFKGRERIVCVGRYCHNPGCADAEIAITVHDDCQRHGIGTFLFEFLAKIARENGIFRFTADVMADNRGMIRLIRKCAESLESTLEAGIYHFVIALDNCAQITELCKKPANHALSFPAGQPR